MNTKKEKDLNKVTDLLSGEYIRAITSSGESVQIKKSDLLPLATTEQAGLMSAADKSLFARCTSNAAIHVFSSLPTTGLYTISLLVSVAYSGSATQRLYFITILKASGVNNTPTVRVNALTGTAHAVTFKYTYDNMTGETNLYIEPSGYTLVGSAFFMSGNIYAGRCAIMEKYDGSLTDALEAIQQ